MSKKSAGILIYRWNGSKYEVLLVHPGGPFWAKKDLNSWSIPKGEFSNDEDPFSAAKREFKEETGFVIEGDFIDLGTVKQAGGKLVFCWAIESDIDCSKVKSNLFKIEWPMKSGRFQEFPEIDKACWFTFEMAKEKILKGQLPFLVHLSQILNNDNYLN